MKKQYHWFSSFFLAMKKPIQLACSFGERLWRRFDQNLVSFHKTHTITADIIRRFHFVATFIHYIFIIQLISSSWFSYCEVWFLVLRTEFEVIRTLILEEHESIAQTLVFAGIYRLLRILGYVDPSHFGARTQPSIDAAQVFYWTSQPFIKLRGKPLSGLLENKISDIIL